MIKPCSKCKIEKELSYFYKKNSISSDLSSWCKECFLKKNKEYYEKNREKIIKQNLNWKKNNREIYNLSQRKLNNINRDKIRKYHKYYRDNNKEKMKKNGKIRYKKSMKIPETRILRNLRSRLNKAIRGNLKNNSTKELLGCSILEFKKQIEGMFKKGMNWDNYGMYGWHIDHIIPCASFDFSKKENIKLCFNHENLQPLWAFDNLSKGSKFINSGGIKNY